MTSEASKLDDTGSESISIMSGFDDVSSSISPVEEAVHSRI